MAMTKAEVCCAFRTVMAADYADIPAKDSLEHTFSQEFYAKMDSLIVEQKRGSWRLLSAQARRALVAAIILALSLLLVACTPRLREAVTELVVTVYETFVRFTSNSADSQLRTEIEIIYDLNPVPEGFELVSQTQNNPYRVETVWAMVGAPIIISRYISGHLPETIQLHTVFGSTRTEPGDISIRTRAPHTSMKPIVH